MILKYLLRHHYHLRRQLSIVLHHQLRKHRHRRQNLDLFRYFHYHLRDLDWLFLRHPLP